jgi:cytochrome P450
MSEDTIVGDSDAEIARNRSFGAGVVDDPYPTLHELRAQCPVHRSMIADSFPGMEGLRAMVPTGVDPYSVYGYETALEVLRRPGDFASAPFYFGLTASIGPSVIAMDGLEHRRMRSLVQPAFARREMQTWKQEIIGPIVDEHLDRIAPLGRCDLYQELASKVPVHTISAALGLPVDDREMFFEWAVAMTNSTAAPEERAAASQAVGDYVTPIIEARRAEPADDLISRLVLARVPVEEVEEGADIDQRPLSDDELRTFVRLFIIAGAGTTFRAFGLLLYHLLTNPEQLEEVREDRSLIADAIDETLRMDQPLAFIGRVAARDCEIAGTAVPEGSYVEVSVGAANHDPGQYDDPDRFDLHRDKADRHVTFGFGLHRCVGAHLAEAELTMMLEKVLDRFGDLRLDPEAEGVHLTGLGLRMVTKLPVLYTPEA